MVESAAIIKVFAQAKDCYDIEWSICKNKRRLSLSAAVMTCVHVGACGIPRCRPVQPILLANGNRLSALKLVGFQD